jgi:hypothetical protein
MVRADSLCTTRRHVGFVEVLPGTNLGTVRQLVSYLIYQRFSKRAVRIRPLSVPFSGS